jgi:hypothetical protein
MQLCMQTMRQWQPTSSGIRMPSQTRKGVSYLVTLDSCECNSFQHNDGKPCKHICAVRLMYARTK